MKTHAADPTGFPWCNRSAIFTAVSIVAVFGMLSGPLCGQIFIVYAGSQPNEGTISSYNLDGTLANGNFISGLNYPTGITQSGGNLFVVHNSMWTVSEYTNAGATVSTSLFTTSNYPGTIAASGDGTRLFVATTNFNSLDGKIAEYTTAGATVSTGLITGLGRVSTLVESGGVLFLANAGPISTFNATSGALITLDLIPSMNGLAMAVSGTRLFVSNGNTIGEYTTGGVVVNSFLVPGLPDYVTDLAVADDRLYFLNRNHGTIGVYDLNTTALNASLITGLGANTYGFAVAAMAIPEPSTYAAILGAAALAGVMSHRRRRVA